MMKDVTIALKNEPGSLAEMGAALGNAGLSVEGGGAFLVDGAGIAHFLFEESAPVREVLDAAGIVVLNEREVLVQRLNQDEPGQLGKLTRRMADAGVNIEVLYSDHQNQLILGVNNIAAARIVSETWSRERENAKGPVKPKLHTYQVSVRWTGNDGEGTKRYTGYRRDHTIEVAGKLPICASSDPEFAAIAPDTTPRSFWWQASHPVTCFGICISVRRTVLP